MNLVLNNSLAFNPLELTVELVERKGIGHPDTICDAISEKISQYYSKRCLDEFGRVAHHWFDKVVLFGGEADISFGRGELIKPYTLLVAGKCAYSIGDRRIQVDEIVQEAAVDVLSTRLTGFDPSRHLVIEQRVVDHTGPGRAASRYRPASVLDLAAIDDPKSVSNDCNIVCGYSPLTTLEQIVLFSENFLNGLEFKSFNQDVGWDVKVVGLRRERELSLLVNIPFLASQVVDQRSYDRRKSEVTELLRREVEQEFRQTITFVVNPADQEGKPYLVALGSVADTGDVGVTGRGNRVNGLITPMRPMSIEAAAGKNPLDHTGKLYSVLAFDLAGELAQQFSTQVEVFIYTYKGAPTSIPEQVVVNTSRTLAQEERAAVEAVIARSLGNIGQKVRELIEPGRLLW